MGEESGGKRLQNRAHKPPPPAARLVTHGSVTARWPRPSSSPSSPFPGHRPQPPKVRFETRVNMTCVGPSGEVEPRAFAVLSRWDRSYTMETVLVELRREMASSANRKAHQPPEGTTYH